MCALNPSKFCILLTASIDTKGCICVKRRDPRVRERDYADSLKRWICSTDYPIVFCENSNYDLSRIKKTAERYAKDTREIEFIQFNGNDYPRHLGKGYGEGLIIKYAIEHSKLLQRCEYVIKVTGRVFVRNIKSYVETLTANPDFFILYNNRTPFTHRPCFNSKLFISKQKFITDYLQRYLHNVNDNEGYFFEHALYLAVKDAAKNGFIVSNVKNHPRLIGYCGSTDKNLSPNLIIRLADRFPIKLIDSMKEYLRSVWGRGAVDAERVDTSRQRR